MRDVVQELLHGITGQSLILDVPEGRPSSSTSVTVLYAQDDDDAPARPATTGVAAIETNPNTTTAAAAGGDQSDPTVIALTSAAGVALRRPYPLTSTAGDMEWVEIVSLNGLNAVVRTPLINSYAAGSTLQTTRISIGIDPTWIADRGNVSPENSTSPQYRVSWVYVVGGVTYRRQTLFDVVRYSAAHHVVPPDVDLRFPGWLDRVPTDYRREQGKTLIDQAWRALKMDLRADRKLARWVRDLDVVSELVICRANLGAIELAVLHGAATPESLQAARDVYTQRYQQLVREPHTPLAASPMGGQRDAARSPLVRR